MRVLVTGAAGMIGRKLTDRLVADGTVAGKAIASIHLQDIVPVDTPEAPFPVTVETSDLADPGVADALAARLQVEGADAFADSWNDLMEVIVAKTAALTPGG